MKVTPFILSLFLSFYSLSKEIEIVKIIDQIEVTKEDRQYLKSHGYEMIKPHCKKTDTPDTTYIVG